MLIRALDEHADAPLLVLSDAGTITRGEVRDRAEAIVARSGDAFRGGSLGIPGRPTFDNVAWLVASVELGALAVVLPSEGARFDASSLDLAGIVEPCARCARGVWHAQDGAAPRGEASPRDAATVDASCEVRRTWPQLWTPVAELDDAGPPCEPGEASCDPNAPALVLFHGSGPRSTEATRYEWPELVDRIRGRGPVLGARWLLTEPLSSFGGLHVLLEAILGRGSVCVPFPAQPDRQLAAAARAGVTHLSGTASFYRDALAVERRLEWSPHQIAVGGTPVPADLIDDLRQRFPGARLTHIREQPPAVSRLGSRW